MSIASELNRKEFLNLFGKSAAALLATACLGACGSSNDPSPGGSGVAPVSGVDFTIDLTASSSAPLDNPGVGYIYNSTRDIIIAKTTAGAYLALQAPCPHAGTSVYFAPGQSQFICPNHNAIFTTTGAVVSGPVARGLKQFTIVQTGNVLRITG